MPYAWHPDYQKFKKKFEKYNVTKDTILIGHSCGCSFLVRWLGETKKVVNKLILVAPWKINDKHDKWRKLFYEYPVDRTIKERVKEIIMFTADDEADDGKKGLKIFNEKVLPEWGGNLKNIDFDNIFYYLKPSDGEGKTDYLVDVSNIHYLQRINPTTQVALYAICVDNCTRIYNITWNIYH